MYADWSVELGADDPVLDFPWTADAAAVDIAGAPASDIVDNAAAGTANTAALRFYDLKADLSLVDQIPEAKSSMELRKFLLRINAATFPLQTAKCDHWLTQDISAEDWFFRSPYKYVSYVDILFTDRARQLCFSDHEMFAGALSGLITAAPEIKATVEIIVRRCFYASQPDEDGYYFTFYVHGFGETEGQARQQWGIALTLLQNVLVQGARAL
jgi:hypothetical protein